MNKDALYGNKFVNVRENELYLDKIKVSDLIHTISSPCFIFLKQKIIKNVKEIQEVFQKVFPKSEGYYSVKSNYLFNIVETIKDQGFGAQVISSLELNLIKKLNYSPERVIAGGPYLPEEFLSSLSTFNPQYVVIYDLDDFIRFNAKIEEMNGKIQKILVRFASPKYTGRQGIRFTPENIQKILQLLSKCPKLQLYGLTSHNGTQLNSLKNYLDNLMFLSKIAQEFKEKGNLTIQAFNIGGGFPNADSLNKKLLLEILNSVRDQLSFIDWNKILIIYEPGRYIVGDTGFCLAKIIKYELAYQTAFLDIGTQFIPKFMRSSLRFYNVENIQESPNHPIDFIGNMPSDEDLIIKNYNFTPTIKTGDHVLIANVGAYALTFSNRFPYSIPEIVVIDGDTVQFLHKKDDLTDISLI